MALSDLHRPQGVVPSHCVPEQVSNDGDDDTAARAPPTLDFFSRQRSQALQTRLRTLRSLSNGGVLACAAMAKETGGIGSKSRRSSVSADVGFNCREPLSR